MTLFRNRRRPDDEPEYVPEPQPVPHPNVSANGFNPPVMRQAMFDALAERIGYNYASLAAEDFARHIEHDPVNGVEQAYYCLTGKLLETIDALSGAPMAELAGLSTTAPSYVTTTDGPIAFTVFRKDN